MNVWGVAEARSGSGETGGANKDEGASGEEKDDAGEADYIKYCRYRNQ